MEENIAQIVNAAHESGASYIIPTFGMTLRDRQRAHYYRQLDRRYPGMRRKYEMRFGNRYYCQANQADRLDHSFRKMCGRHNIATSITPYKIEGAKQLKLF
jgi:hypothetical protein